MNTAKEIWKDIPGYEGLYQASDLGRIKSIPHKKMSNAKYGERLTCYKGKILSPITTENGYLHCTLRKDNKSKTFKVHRLVLMAFLGHSNLTVDHLNEDKKDNRLSNLQYVSKRENQIRFRTKRRKEQLPTGVYREFNKFGATIFVNGKAEYLGLFSSENEASSAYNKRREQLE